MLDKMIKEANKSEEELVFEIGSNSDLVLENTITGNLVWTIENFAKNNKGYITFPTKFNMIDELINLQHNGRVIIRMSMNPEEIITKVEFGTSHLKERIEAVNQLKKAGYPVGILIAPVVLTENWKTLYEELFITLKNELSPEVQKDIFFEVILMTYSYIHRKINEEAFPNAVDLYNQEIMTGRGKGKYTYKPEVRQEAEAFLQELLKQYFPNNKIIYFS